MKVYRFLVPTLLEWIMARNHVK